MESLIRIQQDIYQTINKGYSNYKKSPKDRITKSYVETRLETLEKQWAKADSTHNKIISEFEQTILENTNYYSKDVYNLMEELYTEYKTTLKERLNSWKAIDFAESLIPPGNNQVNIKLPKITIPTFSGQYAEWSTFKDLYLSLVHNNPSIPDVQKLHYLKSYLSGEAEQLLRHLPVTNENYPTCWNMLENRYNNKKYLVDNILKRLYGQKKIISESSKGLKELHDTTSECLNALKNIGIPVEICDIFVIYNLCLKLDDESRKLWEAETSRSTNELYSMKQFLEFLEHRFQALEYLSDKVVKSARSHHVLDNIDKSSLYTCIFCSDEGHKLGNCKAFAEQDLSSRRNFVQNSNLCYNCLGLNHSVTVCRLPTRCRICKKKHHTLLHSPNLTMSTNLGTHTEVVDSTNVAKTTFASSLDENNLEKITTCFSNTSNQVVLATALVKSTSNNGSNITLRALLDQGSQASFITESAVQLLGLKKVNCSSVITGVGGDDTASLNSKNVVYVKLQSLLDPTFIIQVKAHVLKKLTSFLPERKFVVKPWPQLPVMMLADPKFNIPNRIDLLLGAEVYAEIISEGFMRGPSGTLIAQNTKFGWVLSGNVKTREKTCNNPIVAMHTQINNDDFDLKQFWEIESDIFSLGKKQLTPEEQCCETLYKNTTVRDSVGRYIVKLPFRDVDPPCKYGNSREIAIKRWLSLEKRFIDSPELKKKQYSDVIREYINLGHMEEIPEADINKKNTVYLPYHAVFRENKTTTKFRVVFNASSRDSNGVSLNSDLMVGPTIQPELRHILMKWRRHPICLVADIVKMYRQVRVAPEDTDSQRLVWRNDPAGELQHLRLTRVTFGTAPAPYLAVRTLHQVAIDEGHQYPLASERVFTDYYMDDLLTGCSSVSEGKRIYEEMTQMLNKGGFELQKWSSNDENLRKEINQETNITEINLEMRKTETQNILGLTWNRQTDEFEYSVLLPPISRPVTKRKVISDIAKLFDPMGWISPAIIKAKILIQKLWLSGIQWDDELPTALMTEWITYRQELSELTKVKHPRWINTNTQKDNVELHGFSDASSEAYAAVVYIRVKDETGRVYVHLIAAKTKVAPIKQVSIPRLELCGAVLLAKLLNEIAIILKIPKGSLHAWTDSTVVLAWLSSHPSRWTTFIANRVSEILHMLDRNQWSHVRSSDNPADYGSRGLQPSELPNHEAWQTGPLWLRHETIEYEGANLSDTNLEEKQKRVYHLTESSQLELWTKFSSLQKLIRVLAYCKRFISKLRKSELIPTVWLTRTELKSAMHICIKMCQRIHFPNELKGIEEIGIVNSKSRLTSLNPFLDEERILRVGGRLERSAILNDAKHPIILPAKSHLTNLIIAEAHARTLHGGPQIMINDLRSKYWIMDVKNQVKKFVRKCVICIRYAAQTREQLMGQLPPARVTPVRPFYRSGVDYAGPIQIRTSKGRGYKAHKGYICLFVCMVTKAIHLEAVSDLTSQGFLSAFKRFVARRGFCSDIYSDNGTNFVGAARELKNLFAQENSTLAREIAECLESQGTTWHFIPPHAPHFGGIWEAGIKSTKHHLRRVIGNATLTFEEISTLLYQIEACLNSRPLSYISSDPHDPMPLTPGHFLIGEPLLLVPDTNYETSNVSSLTRWQMTQKLLQHFWRRWSREYLSQFLHRYKWVHQTTEPNIGDVVLIKEDNLPPAKWLLGVIVEKHAGLDNITRVVTLRCKDTSIKRPIHKLCVLPTTPET